MATLTIRSFPDKERDRLRKQAAINGRSMEAEARRLVLEGLNKVDTAKAADKDWLKRARSVVRQSKGSAKDRLTPKERKALKPDAQAALQKLREMFADRKDESAVDTFLSERRAMWGEE
ncbi:MAG: hypothetical protein KBA31_01160 [Alphaproteobacteria bacterium]|nr:hypothetical protein [Alphaproteobacteria bacterium]